MFSEIRKLRSQKCRHIFRINNKKKIFEKTLNLWQKRLGPRLSNLRRGVSSHTPHLTTQITYIVQFVIVDNKNVENASHLYTPGKILSTNVSHSLQHLFVSKMSVVKEAVHLLLSLQNRLGCQINTKEVTIWNVKCICFFFVIYCFLMIYRCYVFKVNNLLWGYLLYMYRCVQEGISLLTIFLWSVWGTDALCCLRGHKPQECQHDSLDRNLYRISTF